ncbi:MAG: amidohydrolase [Planctomycetia bacterium]|nr:MAG: amidohydrolase [Planctomycetia bacterium]
MKIDLHTHILPERWPDLVERYGYPGFVRLEHHAPCRARMLIGDRFFREIEDNCWNPQRRIAECDECGVSMQVLSTVPVMFSYWARPADGLDLSRLLNDHLAGVIAAHPRRFTGLATVPLQDVTLAIRELERCVAAPAAGGLGLPGVQIGSNVNGENLGDASLFPFFEAAAALGAAVFVHPWEMLGRDRTERYWGSWLVGMPAETCLAVTSMLFAGVFQRLPSLRVAFAHAGGSFPGTIGRIQHGFESRPDLCAVDCAVPPRAHLAQRGADGRVTPARFYVDSLTHDEATLRGVISLFGAERVALGSDYPFPLGEARPGAMIEAMRDLDERVRSLLLGGTAREFLRLAD